MGLLDCCEVLFGTSNLYQVLGVEKEASEAGIRRGYYKVSLQVHPDRVPDNEQATEKFQVLGKVYAVLSDKEQRAVYDEQGIVDEESDTLRQDRSWDEYWRLLFPKADANREKREAEKMTKDMGLVDGEDSLKALIQKRQKSREQETNSFLTDLEAKYCKKGGKGSAGKKGKK
ncbi:DNJC9 protein, partial [Polyodon spathula]|nr:DNJC9 protein [Polyodon spathula]